MSRQHIIQTKKAFAQRAGRHIASPKTKTVAIARSSLHPLEEMQALYGNRAVNQLLASQPRQQATPMFRGLSGEMRSPMQGKGGRSPMVLQAKLEIGAVGDKYEQEADRVAKEVVRGMNAPVSPTVQQDEKGENEEEELQKKPIVQRVSDVGGMATSPELEASIQRARGSGQPLSDSVREPIERVFGADFSGVRLHTDAKSDELNRSIQALAFTTGEDIFFREGAYEPRSKEGQELLAHELTHVLQQESMESQKRYVARMLEKEPPQDGREPPRKRAGEATGLPDFNALPDNVWLEIASHLSAEDLRSLRYTSRRGRQIANQTAERRLRNGPIQEINVMINQLKLVSQGDLFSEPLEETDESIADVLEKLSKLREAWCKIEINKEDMFKLLTEIEKYFKAYLEIDEYINPPQPLTDLALHVFLVDVLERLAGWRKVLISW